MKHRLQKIDRIKSQLCTMADLVHEGGGGVDEGELVVLEKSGVLASQKLKGKVKARSMNGHKHVVFVEEGKEGLSHTFSVVFAWKFISTMLLDNYAGPSYPVPAPETASDGDESEIDLGWKPEGRQKRKKAKPKSQKQDNPDLRLMEEESKVLRILVVVITLTDPEAVLFRNTGGVWFRSSRHGWSEISSCGMPSGSWRCRGCSWEKAGRRS